MLRDKFVAGNVDQQILLLEMLTDAAGDTVQQANGRGRDRSLSDKDTGVEVVLVDEVVERADLLRAYAGRVRAEFNVDGSAVGLGFGVGFAGEWSVFGLHCFCGTGADFHLVATVRIALETIST